MTEHTKIASAFDGIRLVLFDLDNTLFTTVPERTEHLYRTCKGLGIPFDDETFLEYRKREMAYNRECDRLGITGDEKLLHRGRALSEATNGCLSVEQGKQIVIDGLRSSLTLLSGTREVLAYCRSLGLTIALASNGYEWIQRERLEKAALLPYFDYIFVSDAFGYNKPDLEFYEKALATCGCEASESLIFGDDAKRDIIGAKKAGLRTCHVTELSDFPTPPEADYVIENFSDFI